MADRRHASGGGTATSREKTLEGQFVSHEAIKRKQAFRAQEEDLSGRVVTRPLGCFTGLCSRPKINGATNMVTPSADFNAAPSAPCTYYVPSIGSSPYSRSALISSVANRRRWACLRMLAVPGADTTGTCILAGRKLHLVTLDHMIETRALDRLRFL